MPVLTGEGDDEWLTLDDAANLLGVGPAAVNAWVDSGELPTALEIAGPRRTFVHRDDVERLRRQHG